MNQNTNVNLIPKFPFSGNLYFSQYDVGRVATINLVEDGSAYTIPSGATVKIQATKPSGLGFSVECTYNGNVVTVVSTETMTNEYGRFPCELRIESGDVLLGTTNFTFNVEKSPHPTNTVDGDSEDIINQITVALNNALSDIQDAKEEAIEEISQSGGGITEAVKVALLNCFSHVAWIDEYGQTYYDALEDALYPPANLVSISAVYTQSGTVYDNQALDSLKSDLIVSANWDDGTTTTVTNYTLSGTLVEGTSTITVAYGGKITTFDVTVTHAVTQYTITNNLTQCVNSNSATVINELTSYSGTLSANSGYIMGTVSITMGGTDITSTAYDSSDGSISIASVTGNIVITAEAIEDVGWVSGVAYDLEEYPNQSKMTIDANSESGFAYASGQNASAKVPCHGANAINVVGATTNAFLYFNEDSSVQGSKETPNTTWGSTTWLPITSSAYYFACSNYTASFPLTATLVPYKLTELGENIVVEVGEHYAIKAGDDSYKFCYGMKTLKLSKPRRTKIDFYDGSKQYLSTTGATNNLITATIPDNAMYFKFDSTYGTGQNVAWFLAE